MEHVGNGGVAGGPSAILVGAINDADFNPEDWLPDVEGGRHRRLS